MSESRATAHSKLAGSMVSRRTGGCAELCERVPGVPRDFRARARTAPLDARSELAAIEAGTTETPR